MLVTLKLCMQRQLTLLGRIKVYLIARWLQLTVLAVITGTVFLRLDTSSTDAGISMIGVLFYDLVVLYVEHHWMCLFSRMFCPVQVVFGHGGDPSHR